MDMKALQDRVHAHWLGLTFLKSRPECEYTELKGEVCFVSALKKAVLNPVLLAKNAISCPGAGYVYGWNKEDADLKQLEEEFAGETGTCSAIRELVKQSPTLVPVEYIGINLDVKPDMYISFLQPADAMKLGDMYYGRFGSAPELSMTSVLSICGHAIAKTHMFGGVNIALGCERARNLGGIERDRLFVAMRSRTGDKGKPVL